MEALRHVGIFVWLSHKAMSVQNKKRGKKIMVNIHVNT